MKKIIIGCDKAGLELKNFLIEELKNSYQFVDKGSFNEDSVDYPDYAKLVAKAILNKEGDFGVLICGTGIGMCIVANKFKGIRASLCHNSLEAKLTRQHNDSNILCMGARMIGKEVALDNLKIFCETDFSNEERHVRRINKIENN